MVIFRKVSLLVSVALACAACTQVLGIDDRTLRSTTVSSDGLDPAEGGLPVDEAGASAERDGGVIVVGTDPARAVFSANAIDFGLVSCGGGAPANRTLTIDNAGDSELDWQASFGPTSIFSIVGASAGPIAGSSFATLTISSVGFPSFATASQTESATLTVVITIPGQPPTSHDFIVTETAAGASLSLDPGVAAFGQVQVGSASSAIPISLKNSGNVATTIAFGSSTDPQYTLLDDAGTMLLGPGESLSGLAARFVPVSAASSTSNISITASGSPMCGVTPSALHLTGAGTNGPVAVQPGSLDFGLVSCGTTAVAKQVTMTTSGTSFAWSASLGKGSASPYVVTPASGTATSGAPVVITVTPKSVPSTSAITPDLYADNLTIVASDGSHVIPLHETAQGAIISQSVSSVAFGGVNTGTKATSSWNVVNDGNAPATLTYATVNAAFAVAPQSQTLGGQGYVSATTATFSPTSTTTYNGSANMTAAGSTVLCAPLPAALPLSGTGTSTYVSVSPSSIDFGLEKCGGKASSQNVTITNTGFFVGPSFNWTATLGKGASSPYTLASSSGTLTVGKSLALKITPNAIPQVSPVTSDYYADSLTITTDATNDTTPHVIALHETAQGVILALSPTTLSFGTVAGGSSASLPFQIVNSGNLPAQVSLALAPGSASNSFALDPSGAITVNGGSSSTATSTFAPSKSAPGVKSTTITAAFPQTNCGGPLAPVSITGTGS